MVRTEAEEGLPLPLVAHNCDRSIGTPAFELRTYGRLSWYNSLYSNLMPVRIVR